MQHKNQLKVAIVLSVYLMLALLDGLLTFIATPDLKLEGNPLVRYFGFGWIALFLANLIIVLLLAAGIYYSFVLYKAPLIQEDGFKEYISMLYFGRPDCFAAIFYRFGGNWRTQIAVYAYALVYAGIASRIILVMEWCLHLFNIQWLVYRKLCSFMPWRRFDLVVAMVVGLIAMFYWFYRQYKENLKRLKKSSKEENNIKIIQLRYN